MIKRIKNYIIWLFRKPELYFGNKLTGKEVMQMVRDKNFYALKKLIPRSMGGTRLSKKQSFGIILGLLSGVILSYVVGNPLPFLIIGTITYGTEYEFHTGYPNFLSCAALDDTHIVVAYHLVGGNGECKIGVISNDDEIAYGSAYIFEEDDDIGSLSVSKIDSTHFVIGYALDDGTTYGYAKFGTVASGNEISYGAEATFNSANTDYMSSDTLDSTHVVMSYQDDGNSEKPTSVVGSISGTTISFGTAVAWGSQAGSYVTVTALDSTHFVMASRDYDGHGNAVVGTISSGTTFTFGTSVQIDADASWPSVTALDSTHFVYVFQYHGNTDTKAAIGVISSGNTITFGSTYLYSSSEFTFLHVGKLDSTHFAFSYNSSAVIGTVASDDEISFGTAVAFGTSYASTNCGIDSTHFAVMHNSNAGAYPGDVVIGTYTPPVVDPTVTTQAVSNIDKTTATGNGNITDDGGDTDATRGMCWSTSSTPTTSDSHDTNGTGEGAYTVAMTSLDPATKYYVRAYSINSSGTSYGAEVEFTTLAADTGFFQLF